MYRKEYTETIFRTGSHTSRKSSVKQHEMAALREMEQMILAAEAVPAGAEALERATAHLEQFLQQVRQKRILDEKQRAMEAFRQQFENGYTWRNGFLRNVARFGDREALIEPESGTVWTYTQLNAEANRLSHALLRAGLQKGDVVMVQLHNCPEFVFAYLACHKTGMVFCPVNFRLSAKEITDCMDNSRPKVFLLEPETQAEVVVGSARRGDEKKRSPQQESPLPENKEKDKPYSMNGDDNRLQSETSGGKRETILLEDARIEVVPEAKKAPRNRSELENEIRRYDAVRSRLTDEERRTADEYYRRLREILQ